MVENATTVKFWNYPPPKQAPKIAYQNDASPNPVLRGLPLAIATSIIRSSSFLQSILWKNARFDALCDIPELGDYEPRYDPTVIPTSTFAPAVTPTDLPPPLPRTNDRLHYSAGDFHAAYTSGRTTPTAVAEALIPLIRKGGKHAVAFLQVREQALLGKAEEATRRYREGKPRGVLDGVPIAVKDEVQVDGYCRWWGTKVDVTGGKGDKGTAWCVEKLEEQGALVLGKTNMHECGLDTTNNNPIHGTPRNPHNPAYYSGGSSGGSAYSAAAGLCPIVIGVDGGGSIRIPASFCGLYGIKPSHGRISARPTPDIDASVCVNGPLASNIEDLTFAYRIMAQPDPLHRSSVNFPSSLHKNEPPPSNLSSSKHIGICDEWLSRMDPSVRILFDAAVRYYTTKLDYKIIQISIPFLPQGQKAHALTILSEARTFFNANKVLSLSDLSAPCQLLLSVTGTHANAQAFLSAQKLRNLLMSHLAALWKEYPGLLILTPTTPMAGSRIDRESDVIVGGHGISDGDRSLKSIEYAFMANFTGAPAISVPMGYVAPQEGVETDVPIGLMAMAEWGAEEDLLAWGKESVGLLDESEGVRRPGRDGAWVDALALATASDGKGTKPVTNDAAV